MACPAGFSALAVSAPPRSLLLDLGSLSVPVSWRPVLRAPGVLHRCEFAGITSADLGLPPWAPSVEELLEFDAMQSMSPSERRDKMRSEAKEAKAAVKGAVAGLFRPLLDNFRDMLGLKYPVRGTEEFHIGMPFVLVIIRFLKDFRKNIVPLDYIRVPVFFIYTISVFWDLTGMKKFAKYALPIMTYGFTTGFQIPEAQRVKED